MNSKIMQKVLATLLAFVMTFANVALLGIYANEAYAAATENLEGQDTTVDDAEIDFDAYFKNSGVSTHTKELDVETEDTLYISIKVDEGYITNASIKIENANFEIISTENTLDMVQSIDTEEGLITLNQISKGESVVLEIPIKVKTDSSFNVEDLSKTATVTLSGTYVNNKAEESEISKEIEVNSQITGEITASLSQEISKYVSFNVNGNEGVLLQTSIKTSIENNILPTKQTKLEIEIPTINNEEPETITIAATSTEATNGQTVRTFSSDEYTYENGIVTLIIENTEDENGNVSWLKDVQDEILVTCIYGADAIVDETEVELNASVTITAYSSTSKEATATSKEQVELTEQVGDLVSFDIETSTQELDKGYMIVSGAQNTEYVDTWSANIGYAELVDSILLTNETKYLDESGNEYTSNQVYTYTKISEENFVEILGEDGYINIYDKEGNVIATLNKDNLEYTYEDEVTYIMIETSKPVAEGILEIENGRGITSLEYSEAQEEMFTGVRTYIIGNVKQNDTVILRGNTSEDIVLNASSSQAELTLSSSNISTVVTNEGVEIRVTLNTTGASTNLYKNPTIEIEFPSYITNLAIENVRLLYENELKIESAIMYLNDSGNRVIKIELSGEQTSFNSEAAVNGATLVMKADITVDELTPSRTEYMKMSVTNAKTNEVVNVETAMNFVAPSGIVTVNQISNYNDNGDVARSISGKTEVGELDLNSSAKTATVSMTVINNYSYNVENLVIVGRTPFEGNTTIVSGKDLGSTFTATMVSAITAKTGVSDDDITVYYSSNETATNDLDDTSNGWTTSVEDLSQVKSYMIVIDGYTLETGETISFEYNVEIPENLDHNEKTYGIFAIYYNKQSEETSAYASSILLASTDEIFPYYGESIQIAETTSTEGTTEVAESTETGVATSEAPDLSVTLSSSVEDGAEVTEGSTVTYTATITNNAETETGGTVYLNIEVPDNAYYVQSDGTYLTGTVQIKVGTIAASSSQTVEFTLKMGSYYSADTGDDDDGEGSDEKYYDEEGNEISYAEAIGIDSNDLLTLSYFEEAAEANGGYIEIDEEGTTATAKEAYYNYLLQVAKYYPSLTSDYFDTEEEYELYQKALAEYLASVDEDSSENTVTVKVTVTVDEYDDVSFESNEITTTIVESDNKDTETELYMVATTSLDANGDEISEGRSIQYVLNMDSGSKSATNVVVKVVIPEGLTFANVESDGVYDEGTRTITWTFDEYTGEESISFRCTTNELADGVYSLDVPVTFTATCAESSETFSSNTITKTIVGSGFTISQTSNISNSYFYSGDEITYAITVKNIGTTTAGATIVDYLPDGLSFVSYYYIQDGETIKVDTASENDIYISVSLDEGESLTIYLTAQADTIGSTETLKVTNKVSLTSGDLEIWADELTHTILGEDATYEGSDSSEGYTISGTAWYDEDEDGMRDSGEDLLQGLTVYLLNSSSLSVVSQTVTSSSGTYSFENISAGSYIVVIDYDTLNYDLTTYQADNVDESQNSDFISMELTLNNTTATYAASDTITLSSNKYNIDLGLVEAPKFDLSLDKSISLIQVSNSNGTTSYTFDNVSSAKVEIPSKYLSGSVVAITYTISITNEGAVAGYAKKIVDYISSDLSFSSTLNPDWYQDSDGNLYSSSLANVLIEPGETKEITLVLTKTMTSENTGLVYNSAEIYETSNDLGLSDIDSTVSNKSTSEDDYSTANTYITPKTGGVVYYVGIALGVVALFALRSIRNKKESSK